MKTLIAFELRKNQKSIITMAIITGTMIVFYTLFFPTISSNLDTLGVFLNTGFMQGIMTAFNVDVFAMKTLMGFFSTYCTMWIVLIGSVFFGYLGSEWIAREERSGTIEFLLSKPLSRTQIFISKAAALSLSCLLFLILVGIVGLAAMLTQLKAAPNEVHMVNYGPIVESTLLEQQNTLAPFLKFNEDDFAAFTMSLLMSRFTENQEEVEASGVDVERIMTVLEEDLKEPEVLFQKMMDDPESYMALLGIDSLSAPAFQKVIEKESKDYNALKETFLKGEGVLSKLLVLHPVFFIEHLAKHPDFEQIDGLLSGLLTKTGLVSKLDLGIYITILIKMYLVVWVNGLLGLSFAAVSKESSSSSQKVMVAVLVFYFVNSLAEIADMTRWLKYLTPFGYIDTAVGMDFKLLVLLGVVFSVLLMALKKYRVKDFA